MCPGPRTDHNASSTLAANFTADRYILSYRFQVIGRKAPLCSGRLFAYYS